MNVVYKNRDFRKALDREKVKDGAILENCMFLQYRETSIFQGVKKLQFVKGGNFINCTLPSDSYIESGLVIKKRFCYHLHSEAPFEEKNCEHAIPHEEYVVDGVTIVKSYIEYNENQFDENGNPKFVEYRHIENGKIVDGKAGA